MNVDPTTLDVFQQALESYHVKPTPKPSSRNAARSLTHKRDTIRIKQEEDTDNQSGNHSDDDSPDTRRNMLDYLDETYGKRA